jgi:hypothetical protein
VKTAFQKMDEKLEQCKQIALALAEALRELPSPEVRYGTWFADKEKYEDDLYE